MWREIVGIEFNETFIQLLEVGTNLFKSFFLQTLKELNACCTVRFRRESVKLLC